MSQQDVVIFGLELDRLEKLDTARLSAHYRKVVDDLSIEGHRAVLEYVERMVAPAMTYGNIDFEGMLLEAPEVFAAHIQNSCAKPRSIPEVFNNGDGSLTNSEINRVLEN